MPTELVVCILALVYMVGSFFALRIVDDLFKLERWVNKNLQIDYFIKSRNKMVIVAALFSWISFFALKRLERDLTNMVKMAAGGEDV